MLKNTLRSIAFVLALVAGCRCATPQSCSVSELVEVDRDAVYAQRLMTHTVQIIQEMIVVKKDGTTTEAYGSGTGVVIAVNDGKSLILTAAHVVRSYPEIPDPENSKVNMKVIGDQISVYALDNKKCHGKVEVLNTANDLALLEVDCVSGVPARLSSRMPEIGANVLDVAETQNFHPDMGFVLADGRYLGSNDHGRVAFSFAGAPGASGSGVFYRGCLVGIVSDVYVKYEHISLGLPIEVIQKLISGYKWEPETTDGGHQ